MFLYLAIVFIGFLLLAYCIRIFRAHFISLAERSLALVNTLLLKIDEDEKLKLVQKKNNQLIVSLGKVFLSIILAVALGSIPFIIYLWATGLTYDDLDLSSTYSIISLTLGSTLGFIIPLKKAKVQSYSELSQLLHRMALNNYAIAYRLFKMEAKKLKKKGIAQKERFVIVSGLARAGTTSVMNKLSEDDHFASLSYANMPFLTAPSLWSKIYKPQEGPKKERSHKDGIKIGLDSNEALEEHFFKVIADDAYIKEDALHSYELTEEQYADYNKYQSVVRKEDRKIYLAKNNNFALRYESMRKFNREFLVVFMFRDPLTHAASLLEKHKEFTAMQREDGFVLEYMNWLGHHEFGLNQKPFQFSEEAPDYLDDKESLDYWLQIWINYYSHLLTIDRTKVIFVDYNYYCEHPNEQMKLIFQEIGIDADLPEFKPYLKQRKVDYKYSEALKSKADQLHNELQTLIQSKSK